MNNHNKLIDLKPFLQVDNNISIHLARHELAQIIFDTVNNQRDYLREWLPWVDATKSVADTNAFIKESMQHNTNGTRLTTFILFNQKLAGSIGVVSYNKDNHSCEIGYWLNQEMQGQGVMTKTCKKFIDHLFRTKNINRIEIKTATKNIKSKAIPERLSFTHEGILRQALYMYKSYYDVDIYSLLRKEWQG